MNGTFPCLQGNTQDDEMSVAEGRFPALMATQIIFPSGSEDHLCPSHLTQSPHVGLCPVGVFISCQSSKNLASCLLVTSFGR